MHQTYGTSKAAVGELRKYMQNATSTRRLKLLFGIKGLTEFINNCAKLDRFAIPVMIEKSINKHLEFQSWNQSYSVLHTFRQLPDQFSPPNRYKDAYQHNHLICNDSYYF